MAGFKAIAAELTESATFDPMFRTLTVTRNGNLMDTPLMRIGAGDELIFSFDEIADDRRYLRCRLLHCNADWQPSRLVESEYVDGFNEDQLEDFGYSRNTYVHYVNYRYVIGPESGLQPLVSGNYVWQVYDEEDPDRVLLQMRFQVAENNVGVSGRADGRTDRGFNDTSQQLTLAVGSTSEVVRNPYTDLIIEVMRNGRPDTRRIIEHPQRVEGDRAIYEHLPQLIFNAGNEYRRFETVRSDYPGMHVDSVRYADPMYHAYIAVDAERAGRGYVYDSTQRGRYKIDEYNATDPDLGADYIMTHFTLDYPEIMDGDVYVEGELALRGYTDVNRMTYDRTAGLYRLDIPLKQGSYNYQYVVRRKSDAESLSAATPYNIGGNAVQRDAAGRQLAGADESLIEGNHYETVNEYNVSVYLREPGARADRLLAVATIVATP